MTNNNKLKKKIELFYGFNIDTENDRLLEHVRTAEEAKIFLKLYGSVLESGCEEVKKEIYGGTDPWQFWCWLPCLIIILAAVLLNAFYHGDGPSGLLGVIFIVSVSSLLGRINPVLAELLTCKKARREARKLKKEVMLKGLTDQEILEFTNAFIDKHNRVWETQQVYKEIRKKRS